MFRVLGKAVTKTWPILLVGWVVLLAVSWSVSRRWDDIAQEREFAFLPADSPSRRGEEIFQKAFPEEQVASNVVLVLRRGDERVSLEQAKTFIEDRLEPRLRQLAEEEGGLAGELAASDEPLFPGDVGTAPQQSDGRKSIIRRIRTPNAPGTGALLVSEDGRALLVVVELTAEFMSKGSWPTIEKIEHIIGELRHDGQVPPGLDIFLTGSAIVSRDYRQAQFKSAKATDVLTVVLVVVLLILIYRAPLLALIPLVTVFFAVQIALGLLVFLAEHGYVTVFPGLQIYITVLTYGAGVDYCLFLMARYKEELDAGADPPSAVASAIGNVGAALAASAGTVMCGIGMMYFAEFGKFRQAGIGIPLSLFIVLCGTLTLSPSLLRLAGPWAFWPRMAATADAATVAWFHRVWEKLSQALLGKPGRIWVASVAIMAPFAATAVLGYHYTTYDIVGNLPADAPSVAGTRVLEEHFPAGVTGPVTVLLVNNKVDFSTERGRALAEELTGQLRDQREELGLADLRSVTAPLGITQAAERVFTGLDVPKEAIQKAIQQEAIARYTTDFGERAKIGTRIDLILNQNPFARQSIDKFERMERVVQSALPGELQESELYFIGPTASIRDLRNVVGRDQTRIEVLVLAGVFVILFLLLRRLIISLYLIVSVLFSYYATLGVAVAVFWLLDPTGFAGIDWKVPLFLFTILIAVGEDYNIFLMTRIDEEQRRRGPLHGITEALVRTGPIISSCGIIMAGTFASLLAGSLTEMKQLGFALAFGVLLDTFVVRPILVPAFLILLQTGRLRPSAWRRSPPPAEARTDLSSRARSSS